MLLCCPALLLLSSTYDASQQRGDQTTLNVSKPILIGKPGRQTNISHPSFAARVKRAIPSLSTTRVAEIKRSINLKPSATQFTKVTLTGRKPYSAQAQLNLLHCVIYDTTGDYYLLAAEQGLSAQVEAQFKAAKAGDVYLVTMYISNGMDGALFKVFSSGSNPDAEFTLYKGDHAIPLIVVPQFPGDQYVQLVFWFTNVGGFYFDRVEIELLKP
ncbi:MAG: hypothetical protein KIT74_02795 [Fimbriimonadales bacterium]|nr:hypothetical protein [Fimbriimonadales bacterium]